MSVSTYGPRCPKPEPNVDGVCRNCGRPTAFVGTMLQHKRGRWREPLGLAKPRGQAIVIRSAVRVVPAAHVPNCRDCDAYMQLVDGAWRCPWTTGSRFEVDVDPFPPRIYCNWPFKNPDNRRVA